MTDSHDRRALAEVCNVRLSPSVSSFIHVEFLLDTDVQGCNYCPEHFFIPLSILISDGE